MRTMLFALLFALLVLMTGRAAAAAPLLVTYIEKPPYYYTDGMLATGFLLHAAQEVFAKAEVPIKLAGKPARRVLHDMQSNAMPTCSIGWFKLAEREAFAKFSAPIHQDKAMAVLTERSREAAVRKHASLRSLIETSGLRLGVVDGFSYGSYIDQLIREMPVTVERALGSPINNLKKLALGRIDYTIVDVEELEYLAHEAQVSRGHLAVLEFSDMPRGNQRYIMCSKKVDDALIDRLNQAIKALGMDLAK
ncbi:MAG: transporter substrate-binding domain-containing protein [Pseudomonadota bacterium]